MRTPDLGIGSVDLYLLQSFLKLVFGIKFCIVYLVIMQHVVAICLLKRYYDDIFIFIYRTLWVYTLKSIKNQKSKIK